MGWLDDHLLTAITFLPAVTALALVAVNLLAAPLRPDGLPAPAWRALALVSTAFTFLLSLRLFVQFDPVDTSFQFVEYRAWIADFGVNYFVGVDGISLFLVVLVAFLMPIVVLASWNDIAERMKSFFCFLLLLETGMTGAFVSLNLFQFYFFWELLLVPMLFIIGIWGGPRRVYAAVKFFLFTVFGSLFMLVAMIVVCVIAFEQSGALNFDLVRHAGAASPGLLEVAIPAAGADVWWKTQPWLFAAFALAFAVKVPVVPLHTWLPDAHVEAPTSGSIVLAGVLLKLGTYGFLRFGLSLFPEASLTFSPWMLALGVTGILYGSLIAMVQPDLKRLVAYSSVAHMGFVIIGIFALNVGALVGGVLQMINHGVTTGALFLLVGFLYERRHTREIASFGGIAKPMPVYAAVFAIVMFASIGLPMLNGFVGEFLILLGLFLDHPAVAALATIGVVLAAAYMLWMYRRVMFGPVEEAENRRLIDLTLREKVAVMALLVPIFWIGLYPDPFLRRIEPSVIELLGRERFAAAVAAAADPAPEPAAQEAP
jgi:NADH-quinone oxidoreductase subunit M